MHRKLIVALVAMLLGGCAAQQSKNVPTQPAVGDVDVVLYRGLRLLPGTANQIDWSRNSFGVSGVPLPTLSFFDNRANPNAFPCWLSVTITVPGNAVNPGAVGSLTIPNPAPGGANAGPWAVSFNNVPAGHWEISKLVIALPADSNNVAGNKASAVFDGMAHSNPATAQVLDGSAVGCH